ncbi:MAG: transcription-repair coupling factor, partial [Pseudomonadales bacterium]
VLVTRGDVHTAAEQFWKEVQTRYEQHSGDVTRPLLPPQQAFLPVQHLFEALKKFPSIHIDSASAVKSQAIDFTTQALPDILADARSDQPYQHLENLLSTSTAKVLFCCESAGRRETLLEALRTISIVPENLSAWPAELQSLPAYGVIIGPLQEGFHQTDPAFLLICEDQVFGQRVRQTRRREGKAELNPDLIIKNLTELQLNAPVVHIEQGVGRYRGLISFEAGGTVGEYLHLEYADNTQLYVPVASLHMINRYVGAEEEHAPWHKLGSEQWQVAKRKAAARVADVAAELLLVHAQRAAQKGFAFSDPGADYQRFCQEFPFEETPDQQQSIAAVRADMLSNTPMDRLVCGDVGFGKTEIALRAAFIAVQNSKQVVLLVPTTLLAQQHFETFQDRFADWPIKIDVVSRFRNAREHADIEQGLLDGRLDIVIGTHKLLQKKLQYKNLGLLIVDEEHRFGVKQKERLKALRSEVDILTLTATPIPRTLNMAVAGMRDLSIIATPPARRLSVKTFVRERQDSLVREAILREVLRGGQVYFLHNEVKTIDNAARDIEQLVPEATVGIGHGQMRERTLERVMSDFYHRRFNVLVCTTIIESGIDIPTANTIIIERAGKLGLAQIHQLRGRVGRSHHQAYAYLLTPNARAMTKDAVKRLVAIEQAATLGSGFTLATHDLEIRGAGELLGAEQSGQIQNVGYTLYMEMLERAVQSLQNGETVDLSDPFAAISEVNLRVSALIPEDYLPDVHNRLSLYKRIASASNDDAAQSLMEEMIDRFGIPSEPIKNLFRVARLRRRAQAAGIKNIDCGPQGGKLEFGADTSVEPFALVTLVQQQPHIFKMDGATRLRFKGELEAEETRFKFVEDLLSQLCIAPAA